MTRTGCWWPPPRASGSGALWRIPRGFESVGFPAPAFMALGYCNATASSTITMTWRPSIIAAPAYGSRPDPTGAPGHSNSWSFRCCRVPRQCGAPMGFGTAAPGGEVPPVDVRDSVWRRGSRRVSGRAGGQHPHGRGREPGFSSLRHRVRRAWPRRNRRGRDTGPRDGSTRPSIATRGSTYAGGGTSSYVRGERLQRSARAAMRAPVRSGKGHGDVDVPMESVDNMSSWRPSVVVSSDCETERFRFGEAASLQA